MDRLAIVVPCYNEEEMLPITTKELTGVLDDLIRKEKIASNSYILYVDDGSKDATWELIEKIHKENKKVFGLKLAGNVGHQFALTAGMMQAKEDADILISGGVVTAVVSGKHELVSIKIDPEAVDPDDVEMLEDLIVAAVNSANQMVDAASSETMSKIGGGFGL